MPPNPHVRGQGPVHHKTHAEGLVCSFDNDRFRWGMKFAEVFPTCNHGLVQGRRAAGVNTRSGLTVVKVTPSHLLVLKLSPGLGRGSHQDGLGCQWLRFVLAWIFPRLDFLVGLQRTKEALSLSTACISPKHPSRNPKPLTLNPASWRPEPTVHTP